MKWAWNDSHAFVVLNDDAEHFDKKNRWRKVESATI
jgi:hypothetical protein